MAHIDNGRFTFSKGLVVGGAAIAGAAAYLFRRGRRDVPPRPVEQNRPVRQTGPTIAWLVMFSVASAVAIYADRRLKRLRDILHA